MLKMKIKSTVLATKMWKWRDLVIRVFFFSEQNVECCDLEMINSNPFISFFRNIWFFFNKKKTKQTHKNNKIEKGKNAEISNIMFNRTIVF